MNLTLKKLKQLIKEEMVNETQKALGIPHGVDLKDDPDVLYKAAMDFLSANPHLGEYSPKREEAELLMKILNNTIQGSVQHSQRGEGDYSLMQSGDIDGYIASMGHETTPEETANMKDKQGKLRMVRTALQQAMGKDMGAEYRYQNWRASKKDFFKSNPDYTPGDNDDY